MFFLFFFLKVKDCPYEEHCQTERASLMLPCGAVLGAQRIQMFALQTEATVAGLFPQEFLATYHRWFLTSLSTLALQEWPWFSQHSGSV
jgi:hypothetical protein